jgi:hypothetical protein
MESMLIVWNCIVIIAVAIVLVISASMSLYIYMCNSAALYDNQEKKQT